MNRIRCTNCGAIFDRPLGTIEEINRRFYCTRCHATRFALVGTAPPAQTSSAANKQVATTTLGALLGAALGGPPGAIVGGVIGAIVGGKQ